ncbi:MAG TPA: valine--tRNA ligase, partial [Mariprofundaceae bacterium]|nr:valine--tRNA ligase [Mariprofundaceae bacterium]
LIGNLARLDRLDWLEAGAELDGAAVMPLDGATLFLPLAGLVDVGEELARLAKQQTKLDKDIAVFEGKLGNASFRGNAPAEVVAEVEDKLDKARAARSEIESAMARLHALS